MTHVEMIIDYITDGSDFQYSDNHGVLTRCRDCKYNDMPPTAGNAGCTILYGMCYQDGFCSLAERREVSE